MRGRGRNGKGRRGREGPGGCLLLNLSGYALEGCPSVLCCGLANAGVQHHVIQADIWEQEAELMLTNPCDAFRGQSRSPNIVPNVRYFSSCAIVILSLRRAVIPIFDFKKYQGHWKCHRSIERVWLPILLLLLLTMYWFKWRCHANDAGALYRVI